MPGNMRQRIRRQIEELSDNPRPSNSKQLQTVVTEPESWRLRIDRWRIIYLISESDQAVDILAIRKRPPYDYKDLSQMLERLS